MLTSSTNLVIEIYPWWRTDLEVMDDSPNPEYKDGFKGHSHTNTEAVDPGHIVVYLFTSNNIPNSRTSGVPELTTRLRTSFDPEPQWLDDASWYDSEEAEGEEGYSSREVKDGLCLDSYRK